MKNENQKRICDLESPLIASRPIITPGPGAKSHCCAVAKIKEEFTRVFNGVNIEFIKRNGELATAFDKRWQLLLTDSNTVADIFVLFSSDANLGEDYVRIAQIVYYHFPEAITINNSAINNLDLNTPLILRFDYDEFKQFIKEKKKRRNSRNRRPKITGILKSIVNKILGVH
jgi:hypothetical protein